MNAFNPGSGDEISEINVTPFVDVLLVLLIIFMVTAPLVTKTIAVNLPEESVEAKVDRNSLRLTLTVNEAGEYFHEGRKIDVAEVGSLAAGWIEQSDAPEVSIRADELTAYKSVTSLMAALKNGGIQNVGLIIKNPAN